jgi:hypothetical protein
LLVAQVSPALPAQPPVSWIQVPGMHRPLGHLSLKLEADSGLVIVFWFGWRGLAAGFRVPEAEALICTQHSGIPAQVSFVVYQILADGIHDYAVNRVSVTERLPVEWI